MVMLETWEAATQFLASARKSIQMIEIARFAGWRAAWVSIGNR
jgi:hypothetical protein